MTHPSPELSVKRHRTRRGITVYALLMLIFAASIMPIYAMGLFSNLHGIRQSESYVLDTLASEVAHIAGELDYALTNVRDLMVDNNYDNDIVRFSWGSGSHLTQYEQFQVSIAAQTSIHTTAARSNIVDAITVYFPSISKKLDSEKGADPMSETDRQYCQSLVNSRQLIVGDDWGDLKLVVNGMTESGGLLTGTLLTSRLSREKVGALLRRFVQKPSEEAIALVNQRTGRVVLTTNALDGYEWDDILQATRDADQGWSNGTRFSWRGTLGAYALTMNGGFVLTKVRRNDAMFNQGGWFLYWLIMGVVCAAVTVLLYVLIIRRIIRQPVADLMTAFERVERGDLTVPDRRYTVTEFEILYGRFGEMARRLKSLIDREYRQQLLIKDAQYKLLQMQINPHFMYNVCFMLDGLIYGEDYESAAQLSRRLGIFLQYIAHNDSPYVPLSAELRHTRAYAEIQMMRYPDTLRVSIDEVPEALNGLMVPKLILQPLMENAFLHGVRAVRNAQVALKIRIAGADLLIEVSDNGKISDARIMEIGELIVHEPGPTEGIALNNINSRLMLNYGSGSGLRAARSDMGGLMIQLIIEGIVKAGVQDVGRG